jgi:hypothetical protein
MHYVQSLTFKDDSHGPHMQFVVHEFGIKLQALTTNRWLCYFQQLRRRVNSPPWTEIDKMINAHGRAPCFNT